MSHELTISVPKKTSKLVTSSHKAAEVEGTLERHMVGPKNMN